MDFSGAVGQRNDTAHLGREADGELVRTEDVVAGARDRAGVELWSPSGTGGLLVKSGSGTLTLSGRYLCGRYHRGCRNIAGQRLDHGVQRPHLNSGGTLGGTGNLPGVVVNAGGNLAPGNSIGTITVYGDLRFNTGSFYTVEISPAAADRTHVTGASTLTGPPLFQICQICSPGRASNWKEQTNIARGAPGRQMEPSGGPRIDARIWR